MPTPTAITSTIIATSGSTATGSSTPSTANLPFDRFTVEQVAGDLLPDATVDQKIASGFNRNTMVNFEGGADPEEYLTKYIGDRVTTTATVFLGVTLACAECHDHKYDPFTQKDFYRFYAFFNGIAEQGLDGNKESPAPRMKVPDRRAGRPAGRAPRPSRPANAPARPPMPRGRPRPGRLGARSQADSVGRLDRPRTGRPRLDRRLDPGPSSPTARSWPRGPTPTRTSTRSSPRPSSASHPGDPPGGADAREPRQQGDRPGRERQLRPDRLRGRVGPRRRPRRLVARPARAGRGRLLPGRRRLPGRQGDRRRPVDRLGRQRRHQARGPPGPLRAQGPVRLGPRDPDQGPPPVRERLARHAIGRFRLAVTDGRPADARRPAEPGRRGPRRRALEADRGPGEGRSGPTSAPRSGPRAGRSARRPTALKAAEAELEKSIPVTMVMAEMAKPRPTHVLMRGDFRSKGPTVEAGRPREPAAAPARPAGQPAGPGPVAGRPGQPAGRPGDGQPVLAAVLRHRDRQDGQRLRHPGRMAQPPRAARLAGHRVRRPAAGTSRRCQKLIVTSAAYRQDSKAEPALARGRPREPAAGPGPAAPARRRGDPRQRPGHLAGCSTAGSAGRASTPTSRPGSGRSSPSAATSAARPTRRARGPTSTAGGSTPTGSGRCRYPSLATFDAPNREVCTVQRPRTNTPLQALVLLNDPAYVEAARVLAQRVMTEGGPGPERRMVHAFRLCVGPAPDRPRAGGPARPLSPAARPLPGRPEGGRGPDPGRRVAPRPRPRPRRAGRLDGDRQRAPEPRRDHHQGVSPCSTSTRSPGARPAASSSAGRRPASA